ncbi:unnamed protein product [Cuscuta epithymum]|uniref:KIB1-4 beta-propeller domain-containing protein n=1 Tax=Cuscuta epithymum TaxID=186058 RepID=A0AAV0F0P0_9ASTE|nr:unnamed protein product [Cuscuta epithymum]
MISHTLHCSKIQYFQGKKVKLGDDPNNESVAPNILKEANNDILLEIFLRLRNCRSAILCGVVSPRWHSLISHCHFIRRFIAQHQELPDRYPLPYTIIFHKAEKNNSLVPPYFNPICRLLSKESNFLHHHEEAAATCSSSSSYLDFLPSPVTIRASCNDLLLVSPGPRCSDVLYVCNPTTKEFYQLPKDHKIFDHSNVGHALVIGNSEKQSNHHFKVVIFRHPHPYSEHPDTLQTMAVFCSKSGKWKKRNTLYPTPMVPCFCSALDVVTCNEILFWLECTQDVNRVISSDLRERRCGVIDFPNDFWWFRLQQNSSVRRVKQQIGAVDGELRLLQVVLLTCTNKKKVTVNLKVWKLSSSWVLVHDKRYPKRPNHEKLLVAPPFLHPTNGDVVFVVWGKSIFQYSLMEDVCELIHELQEPVNLKTTRVISFPLVHPIWPTKLPSMMSFSY